MKAKKLSIKINKKDYTVKLVTSEEDMASGLQNVKELPESEGMLFDFEEAQEVSFWMKDTLIPLDLIFIDEDHKVIKVVEGEPESEEAHICKEVSYVLEVNPKSGVSEGDELEFRNAKNVKDGMMHVLDSEGNSQMDLDGGERIFSRKNTKTLIVFARKADSTELDKDYKALGVRLFKFIKQQDDREPEHVENSN